MEWFTTASLGVRKFWSVYRLGLRQSIHSLMASLFPSRTLVDAVLGVGQAVVSNFRDDVHSTGVLVSKTRPTLFTQAITPAHARVLLW